MLHIDTYLFVLGGFQGEAAAHERLTVKAPLLEILENRIIALGRDIEWPP